MHITPQLQRNIQLGLSATALAVLAACGGGGTTTAADAQLTGVAAYGAPMAGATVTVTDVNGISNTAIADGSGNYRLKVTGMTAPFVLNASATSGDSVKQYVALVPTAPKSGETATANVTPLTHAMAAMVSSDGASPNEFANTTKLKILDTGSIKTAWGTIKKVLVNNLTGLDNFDPLTTPFKADRSSAADVLLDTIKVSVSDQGVILTNARVPASATGATESITLKGTTDTSNKVLAKATVSTDDLKGLDNFVKQVNDCLALAPAERVSKELTTGTYTFLGTCANVTGFDTANYKAYGYTLNQLWGPRLLNKIPANSSLLTPEFLLFLEDGKKAIVRLATTSSSGGVVYFETAAKNADGVWQIVGNQRNYDASVGVRLYRQNDVSTNSAAIPSSYTSSADAGKNVGKLDAYTSRLSFSFNQTGPNGSDVYAVRVKGPGLPASGVVLARSSVCGTRDYLGFYSNNGSLPPTASTSTTTNASSTNTWVLDATNFGPGYKGTDFYNQYRGLTNTGAPSISTSNNTATTAVDMKDIPEFALYTWEVFTTASGSSAAETFTSRLITRPLAAKEGSKVSWPTLSKDALDYLDPTNASKSTELTSATVSWSAANPAVNSAYVYGQNSAGRMSMGQNVTKLGDTSLNLSASTEADGNGKVCSYAKVPAFSATAGYREVGVRQTTDRGLTLQQYSYHTGTGRAAN